MRTSTVLTLTGPDRVGIVEEVTRALLEIDGNVETSRMVRLGGEFAMLMLVSLPLESLDGLESALGGLQSEGYKALWSRTEPAYTVTHPGWALYRIGVRGADHEGIIHEMAQGLSQEGINIESLETSTGCAPMSAAPLFSMTALVAVPPSVGDTGWIDRLQEAGHRSGVDVTIAAAQES